MNGIEISQQNLVAISQSEVLLAEQLNKIDSVRAMMQNLVLAELQRLSPDAYISRTYINATRNGTDPKEPTGLLMDVFWTCLTRAKPPVYEPGSYGVYDWKGSSDESDRIQGLSVTALGKLIADVLSNLPERYSQALELYWSASAGTDAQGKPQPSRSVLLRHAQKQLFMRELSALVHEQGLERDVNDTLQRLLETDRTGPFYSVSLQLESGRFATLAGCGVIDLNDQSGEELIPRDHHPVVLYTLSQGLQAFSSSAALQRALLVRLSEAAQRQELLRDMALLDAEQVRDVPDLRYMKVHEGFFESLTTSVLVKQRRDMNVYWLKMQGSSDQVNNVSRAIEDNQRLQILRSSMKSRTAHLIRLIANNARPRWVKNSSETNQQIYASLEQRLLETQVQLHGAMKELVTYDRYVHAIVEDYISPNNMERIDPDSIFVSVTHTVKIGTRWIENVERKSLTQLFMYGVHDQAGRFSLKLENVPAQSDLSLLKIESALNRFELKLDFSAKRKSLYRLPAVKQAMREVLSKQIALSMFAAILQKHVSPKAQAIVQRYQFGDINTAAFNIAFRAEHRPFKDMIAFREKAGNPAYATHVLYAPGAPGGQQWFEFPDLNGLKRQFIKWGYEKRDREFFLSQVYSEERLYFTQRYLSVDSPSLVYQDWWWGGVTLVEQGAAGSEEPLMDAVQNLIDWNIAEEEVITPGWYRAARIEDRRLFTRLHADFKAIHGASGASLFIESLPRFARNLVMKTLNEHLSRSAPHPLIDPDRVTVKLDGHETMTLTQMFIQWQFWRSDTSAFIKLFSYVSRGASILVQLKEVTRTATFRSLDNASLGRLSVATINELIDVLPAERYTEYLNTLLADNPDNSLKAKLYCKVKQNEMLRAGLKQKLKGTLSADQFEWLRGLIENLDHDRRPPVPAFSTPPGEGVYTFVLERQRVLGAYVFSRYVNGRMEQLIYVPNTQDERDFRPLDQLTQGLKYHLGSHVVSLVRLKGRNLVQRYVDECRKNLNGPALPPPVLRDSYPVQTFTAVYKGMVEHFLHDVDYQTTSSSEAFWRDVLIVTELAVDIVSLLVPPVGMVASVLRITRSILQGLIAYSEGDDQVGAAYLASAWRSAVTFYVGKVAGVGTSVSGLGMLSRVKDISELMSTVSGVPMGIDYVTAMVSITEPVQSKVRIVG